MLVHLTHEMASEQSIQTLGMSEFCNSVWVQLEQLAIDTIGNQMKLKISNMKSTAKHNS